MLCTLTQIWETFVSVKFDKSKNTFRTIEWQSVSLQNMLSSPIKLDSIPVLLAVPL